jgi:hypothetical protein
MPEDVDLMKATIILMTMVLLSIVVVVAVLPVADLADYQISLTDSRSMPKAGAVFHQVHFLMLSCIAFLNLLTVIWYIKTVFSKHTYTRDFSGGM